MATIKENIKNGKIVSFYIKASLGRDHNGKQILRRKTWYPEAGMSNARSRKAAAKVAAAWEAELKLNVSSKALQQDQIIPRYEEEQSLISFSQFVYDIWLPLAVDDGMHRSTTVRMYASMLNIIAPYFSDTPIQRITSIQISKYLSWLRNDYRTYLNKPLSESSIKHHYDILKIIFMYAEKHDYITSNPLRKVTAPRVQKKKVDALSKEEATLFFQALDNCDLEFRCLLLILITAGLRRGECLGLQWQDIDFDNATMNIKRSVTYTSGKGIEIQLPKTINSIRTIPIIKSTLQCLNDLFAKRKSQYPHIDLSTSFIFCLPDNPLSPRDPTRITEKTKRFFRRNGLPDMSPHDLRHSCASLLLANGADIKSVQDILGHADARTTLNYYTRTDLSQTRAAANKLAAAFDI